jgi:Ethylbenzene dehydrogenase
LKAVYTADSVYFLLTYDDPTESWFRSPWQKQEDGTWKQIKDPDDKGGDNNLYYEDKFAMIWNINNTITDFNKRGCGTVCHDGENPDLKPYGNKYTAAEGELGDIWHWKSIRNLNQIDDQYLDWTQFNAETAKEAGRKSDAKESGGYADNFATMPDPADSTKTVPDKSLPGFTSPNIDLTTGAPGFILDSEKVTLDQAALDALPVGSYIPAIIKSEIVGDRGNISAGWIWADGVWTIEFGRALETGSETDVQFNDLAAQYFFGLAIFENAQVRHAFQYGVSSMVFKP